MADTTFKNPSATGESYNDFTDPTNAYTSDDTYASVASNNLYQDYYNFSLGVPGGATINGFQVQGEAHTEYTTTEVGDRSRLFIELSWDGGVSWTTAVGQNNYFQSTTDATDTSGAEDYTWARSWSSSELTNSNFRLRLKAVDVESGAGAISLDRVYVKVYYTPPVTTTSTSSSTSSTSTSTSSTSTTTSTSTSTSSTSTSSTTVTSTSTSSTSTSSTSTSSTSTSTSSTSTSSTSTSTSTSTSSTLTTTSTSSTSTSSTSTSTSSTSTSTSTSTTLPYEFSNVRELYFGDTVGKAYRYGENYDDNGEGIPLEIITKEYFSGGKDQTKELHSVKAYSNRNSGLSLYYKIIDTSGMIRNWEYLGRLKGEVTEFNFVYGKNRGNGVQFKLIASGTGIPAIWKGLSFVYSVEGSEE